MVKIFDSHLDKLYIATLIKKQRQFKKNGTTEP